MFSEWRWKTDSHVSAIVGGADYLITFNVKDFRPSDEQFGYQLMTPGAFVQEYEQL